MLNSPLNIEEIKQAIAFDQPFLSVAELKECFCISGKFVVAPSADDAASGAIDQFEVSILVSKKFPQREPMVFETGDRIPREIDRHCYTNGACCTGVWEEWLAKNVRPNIGEFLEGPVRNFFLSQIYFEVHDRWPFGERSHGDAGIFEACVDILGVKNDQRLIRRYLRVLAGGRPKGHWQCPCGSQKPLRHCHRNELIALHAKIPSFLALQLFNKLKVKKCVKRKQK
ncbi:MAG: hypothetical protein GW808_12695 [Sphingomonadales bacterium]|nr:hypothetical protein [Sphingomonadales bacterium]NCO47690.1 hypothetical protein [Sphingomonadales bacterium]NCP00227.1 hypothetical protein [Sphingomonadales bacterium]NCP26855.1 hypothetical protein [Sphingomonadales bacterium]NCP44545.1 hypothetical protein [Sphingomonadales bacterium]